MRPLPVLQAEPGSHVLLLKVIAAVAVLAVGLNVLLAYTNFKYSGKLAEARALVQSHILEAKAASAASARALIAANEANSSAKQASKQAAAHAERARALRAQLAQVRAVSKTDAPLDSIAARIVAARDSFDTVDAEASEWKSAFESQLEATAKLQLAVDTLSSALQAERASNVKLQGSAGNLAKASRRGFWERFVPKVGVGAAAGVNPQGKPDAVVGVTLSWTR